ncbi:NADH:ubiquinone oxidoreductase subunit J [Gemmata obscuriglobus]|uniref:NADH-quinone oxidoreductase subunit J n=1 Tax=Gemmata obscuriglobus TaxID=114 RepID=A0A2Z3GX05_9BACT|nr:NADH-quinone oxidoreductase subunit J [Gemmata obscuriglobus]AWM38999.1 hypothetical protein C1280_19760 [Gemmata obscuriglobus]QEG27977.1 NADH:ubiquinone oxidoreductase subunit J [Gemmata obscuriglobus]VTS05480.1 nadh-ubiquinone plastoquinone oxidoreductase chain 6 : NADH-ubiquinone/plastoquinone oxidoreductase chain 6 OS=Planctomyces limnophilus (strain ATCC 43296 / DSM 3776 / IFAM 1008 / 290) GN=Plim_3866 PE=3 SV=1: Oxidored_q3 [Gemmata obscuriglobus UQM 2246]
MNLLALSSTQQAGGQLALAALLGVVGFYLLLPRPRGRFVPGGIAALIGSTAVLVAWLVSTFGRPMPDVIGTALFWLFSAGALVFGTVLVVQKNPARGAIAFAFVILSVCGLFLLLAAPFLMAATVIIYAGAIIVTFLFVLMLSQAGTSNENDRTREPLYGSFAGFAFVGLVLFTLYQTSQRPKPGEDETAPHARLLTQVVTAEEHRALGEAAARLEEAEKIFDGDLSTATERDKRTEEFETAYRSIKNDSLVPVVGGVKIGAGVQARTSAVADEAGRVESGSIRERLDPPLKRLTGTGAALARADQQAREALARAGSVRKTSAGTLGEVERLMSSGAAPDTRDGAKAAVRKLREEVLLLRGSADLPAGNVRNLGFVLYSQHLLAVELAGTLLLVAVIGAVAITHRKGGAQ